MDKKSFVIYDNWALMLSQMPDEDAGKLIKKICNYKLNGELEEDYSAVGAMFQMIKVALDEDAEKYEEICKMRREQGSKGGKQKAKNSKQKVANGKQKVANGKQMCSKYIAKCSHTDTDTDTDNDNDIENGYALGTRVLQSAIIPPKIEWVKEYCGARNNSVDPQKFFDFYESKGWKVGKEKMKNWQACVRTWENRDKEKPIEKNTHKSQTYDFDTLQKMLEG